MLLWHQNDDGELVLSKRAKMGDQAITALEISPDGSLLGLGTAEGTTTIPSGENSLKFLQEHLLCVKAFGWSRCFVRGKQATAVRNS